MFAGGSSLFDDVDLLGGIHSYIEDLDLRLTQQLIDAGIDFPDSVIFGSTLRLLAIPVGDANNFEPSLLVGRQMRIVDDPSGADNADSVIHALRQFWFVIEMRENIRHFRVFFHKQLPYMCFVQTQTLAATTVTDQNYSVFW